MMVGDKYPNGLIGPIGLNPNRLIGPNRPNRPNKKIGAPKKEAPKNIICCDYLAEWLSSAHENHPPPQSFC